MPRHPRRAALARLTLTTGLGLLLAPFQAQAQPAPPTPAAPVPPAATTPPSDLTLPEVTTQSDPQYPPAAASAGLEATVVLRLDIDVDGRVAHAEVDEPKGHGFDEAALRAAEGLRFSPALRAGRPVPVRILFRYVFALDEPAPAVLSSLSGQVRVSGAEPLVARALVTLSQEGKPVRSGHTDARGTFRFDGLGPGDYDVVVSAAGFSAQASSVRLVGGSEASTELWLEPVSTGEAPAIHVTVQGTRAPRAVTYRKLARRELARVAGNRGDALAALENLPGVARAPALSGLLIVRGMSPESTQIFIDGSFVPNMYHFGGLTSVVPTDMLDHVDFYTGNYSTQYGRGTGGIVDIAVRRPRPVSAGVAQVDLLDARLQLEGPVPWTDLRFIAGIRRSHVDAWLIPLLESQDTSFQAAPVYYDYQAFVERPLADGYLRVGMFGSDDRLKLTDTASASGGQFDQANSFWNLQVLHDARLADGVRARTVASVGYYREHLALGTIRSDTYAYPIVLRSDVSMDLADGLTLHAGPDILYAPAHVDFAVPEESGQGAPDPGSFLLKPPRVYEEGFAFFRPAFFSELEIQPIDRLHIVPGLRLDYAEDTEKADLSPRITARYELVPGPLATTLKGGIGYFHEPPHVRETLPGYGTQALKSIRARQASLAVSQRLHDALELTVEGFHIDLDREITRRPLPDGRLEYQNVASGSAYGAEFLLRYDGGSDADFFGWLSYTASRSRRVWGPREPEVFFAFDQTHILAAVANYRLGAGWEIGARVRAVSGNPITPCRTGLWSSFDANYLCVNGPFQSERAAAFFQLDLRAEKTFQLAEALRLVAYLEIINATAREGRDQPVYNFDYSESGFVSGNLPLLPNLGLRGEFR